MWRQSRGVSQFHEIHGHLLTLRPLLHSPRAHRYHTCLVLKYIQKTHIDTHRKGWMHIISLKRKPPPL